MPEMSQCQSWSVFCSNATLADAFPLFCSGDAADGASALLRARAARPPARGPAVALCVAAAPSQLLLHDTLPSPPPKKTCVIQPSLALICALQAAAPRCRR
jgi:hypothetical protein